MSELLFRVFVAVGVLALSPLIIAFIVLGVLVAGTVRLTVGHDA